MIGNKHIGAMPSPGHGKSEPQDLEETGGKDFGNFCEQNHKLKLKLKY